MLALYRSGRQAEALQAYKAAREMLERRARSRAGAGSARARAAILRQDETSVRRPQVNGSRDPGTSVSAGPATPPAGGTSSARSLRCSPTSSARRRAGRAPPEDVKALVGECVTQMSKAGRGVRRHRPGVRGRRDLCVFRRSAGPRGRPRARPRGPHLILEVVGEYARDIADAWAIPDFAVRVGINTGRAGVGQVGAGSPQTVALGDTVNVAPGSSRQRRRGRSPWAMRPRAASPIGSRSSSSASSPSGRPYSGSSLAARRPDPNRCSSAPPAARSAGRASWARAIGPGRLRVRSGPGHPFPRRARHRKDAHAGGAAVVPTG